jgi:hypothetical protein
MNSSESNGAAVTAVDPPDHLMWTTREVADFLRVCPKTVFNLRKVGLPYVQLPPSAGVGNAIVRAIPLPCTPSFLRSLCSFAAKVIGP